MKIVTINQIKGTKRDVRFTGGNSLRFVLEEDNTGFAMMKTIIPKGGPHLWHYKNHKEVCFCVSGRGVIADLETGESFTIVPDSAYILNNHEKHTFEAIEDTVLISVFNPPLYGDEAHDKNGVYSSDKNYKREKAKKIVELCKHCENYYNLYEDIYDLL